MAAAIGDSSGTIRNNCTDGNVSASEEAEGPNDDDFNEVLEHFSSPWTGQKVMIPLTTKAFFEGTLQPKVTTTTHTRNDNNNVEMSEEMVCMNLGQGFLADMSRDKGAAMIRRRIEYFRKAKAAAATASTMTNHPTPKDKPSTSNKTSNKKSAGGKLTMKKGFLNGKSKKSPTKNKNKSKSKIEIAPKTDLSNTAEAISNNDNQSAEWMEKEQLLQSPEPVDSHDEDMSIQNLPYFEIREEYDQFGNEVNAKAIHMAKELNTLKKVIQQKATTKSNQQHSQNNNGPEDERENILTTLVEHLDLGESNRSSNCEITQDTDDDTSHDQDEDTSMNDDNNLKSLSEQRFDDISKRLDELARLEEQDEKERKDNKNSAKKLQGKSWGKGFLNNNTKETNNISKNKKGNGPKSIAKPGQQAKKISIREDKNQVQEIPRIGQNSIQAVRQAANSNHMPQANLAQSQQQRRTDPNPFEKDVFSGVIQERSPSTAATDPNTATDEPPKRLSRFAQQRLNRN